jgi:hypothetical protein
MTFTRRRSYPEQPPLAAPCPINRSGLSAYVTIDRFSPSVVISTHAETLATPLARQFRLMLTSPCSHDARNMELSTWR